MPGHMTIIQKLQLLDIRARRFDPLPLLIIALPLFGIVRSPTIWPIYICGGISLVLLIATIYIHKTFLPVLPVIKLLLVMTPCAAPITIWLLQQGFEPIRAICISGMLTCGPLFLYHNSSYFRERQLKLIKDLVRQGLITQESWEELMRIIVHY